MRPWCCLGAILGSLCARPGAQPCRASGFQTMLRFRHMCVGYGACLRPCSLQHAPCSDTAVPASAVPDHPMTCMSGILRAHRACCATCRAGELDRERLGALVFSDAAARRRWVVGGAVAAELCVDALALPWPCGCPGPAELCLGYNCCKPNGRADDGHWVAACSGATGN